MQPDDPKLDARLRAVPLPEGLLRRLRATALADDDGLDAALRETAVRPEFLRRLREIPLGDDAELDAALAGVPVRPEFLARLKQLPLATDEELDAALRDVPVPSTLAEPWRRLARRRQIARWTRAMAVSLAIGVAGTYLGTTIVSAVRNRWNETAATRLQRPTAELPLDTPADATGTLLPGDDRRLADVGRHAEVPRVEPAPAAGPSAARPSAADVATWGVPAGSNPLDNVGPTAWGNSSLDNVRDLKRAAGLVPRGIDWPLVPGADQRFLLKKGVHPAVSPAADPRLQSMLVPLGIGGDSYELTRRYLEDRYLPPPNLVRTEEFLAGAVDYEFPRPTQQPLGLTIAAGPSPFGREGACLVQVGVQARELPHVDRPPVHLVLLVDVSASMNWGGRVAIVRRALADLVGRLEPADRLTLVEFSDDARVLVENLGRAEAGDFLQAVGALAGQGATNVVAGLGRASTAALGDAAPGGPAVRIVLLTDGLVEMAADTAERIQQRLGDAAARGVPLHVVDLGQDKQSDPQLLALAAAGRGAVHRASSVNEVRWALWEIVTGQSQVVAREARLRVAFNPKTVLKYRLLGHEATALAGLMPEHPEADFHEGQSATALYEVLLAPGAAGNPVATAELTWYEGAAGAWRQHRTAAALDRKQFAASFAESPPSLQAAALVAQAAEALRKSPFMCAERTSQALTRVYEMTVQVDSRLQQRPSFQAFRETVNQARRAKPAPSRAKQP